MLLKKTTIHEDGTTDTEYDHLKSSFIIIKPNTNGDFGKRVFGSSEERPDSGVAAIIDWVNQEDKPIFISEDQEAFIVGDDGKTIEIIHRQPLLQIWYRVKTYPEWKKLTHDAHDTVLYAKEHSKENSEYEFLKLKAGIDPNSVEKQDKAMITWMLNSKGTSKTWRPCSQMEYEMNRYNPHYGFKQCSPGEDPNQVKQEWLK